MKKKPVFYTELSYVLGLVIMAFAAAFAAKADFGMSMVVAPAYILHLKLSQFLPWFSFGVAEYAFQGLLIVLTVVLVRRFKLSYLFSLVTAFLYGTLLDGAILVIAPLPEQPLAFRLVWFVLGMLLCSFAVSLFFHTYLSPESYELVVKEVSSRFGININRVKTVYDCSSTVLAVALSFLFFGFGTFQGVGWGTVVCALVNGLLISRFTVLLEKHFNFANRFSIERYFR